jgi:hypothetical protein
MPDRYTVIPKGYGLYRYVCAECNRIRYLCLSNDPALRPTETTLGCAACGPARLWHPEGDTPLPLPTPEPDPPLDPVTAAELDFARAVSRLNQARREAGLPGLRLTYTATVE